MATRIRYIQTKPNQLKSKRIFQSERGANYRVVIDTEELTYKIINVRSHTIVRSTIKDGKKPPKNLYTVMEQAKRALVTMGVKFELDIRGLDI